MSKILLSFLGTNEYLPCNYCLGGKVSAGQKFVQRSIADLMLDDKDQVKIIVFLTKAAREKNWLGPDGLKESLASYSNVQGIDIPEGNSEEDIWEIFNIVFGTINEDDNVIFDITHSFRSLPMLGMVLLNYSKFLKNISVDGIYYGAFESLGPISKVKDLAVADRNVPLFDLTPFITLNDWTAAADQLLSSGNAARICSLIDNQIKPVLKATKGTDRFAAGARRVSSLLKDGTMSIETNRGKEIVSGDTFTSLVEAITEIENTSFKALDPVLEKVKERMSIFAHNDVNNGFKAVEWCIDHGLIQQGITILHESIFTYILFLHGREHHDVKLRDDVSSAAKIAALKLPEEKWRVNDRLFVTSIIMSENTAAMLKLCDKIAKYRNDINHAGFSEGFQAADFKVKLAQYYNEFKHIAESETNTDHEQGF